MSDNPVQRTNLAAITCDPRPQLPDGFRRNSTRVGAALGAARTGLSVYELPPGQAISPYHYENPDEEWLLVVSGTPTLRHPGGEDQLEPWDIVFFLRSRWSTPRAEHQRVDRPRRDVLLEGSDGRCRRLPGQRHGLGLDRRRSGRPRRQAKQRRGRRSAVDYWDERGREVTRSPGPVFGNDP